MRNSFHSVVLSLLITPLANQAIAECPKIHPNGPHQISVFFPNGDIAQVNYSDETAIMSSRSSDGSTALNTTRIKKTGTTIVHIDFTDNGEDNGLQEKVLSYITITPNHEIIATQYNDTEHGILGGTAFFSGESREECVNSALPLTEPTPSKLITSSLLPGAVSERISSLEAENSSLHEQLNQFSGTLLAVHQELNLCNATRGDLATKIAGLESEVAIFDVNNNFTRTTLTSPLLKMRRAIIKLKGGSHQEDRKTINALISAFNKIVNKNQRGLFERPALSANQ